MVCDYFQGKRMTCSSRHVLTTLRVHITSPNDHRGRITTSGVHYFLIIQWPVINYSIDNIYLCYFFLAALVPEVFLHFFACVISLLNHGQHSFYQE